jgi:hypothetical protein
MSGIDADCDCATGTGERGKPPQPAISSAATSTVTSAVTCTTTSVHPLREAGARDRSNKHASGREATRSVAVLDAEGFWHIGFSGQRVTRRCRLSPCARACGSGIHYHAAANTAQPGVEETALVVADT